MNDHRPADDALATGLRGFGPIGILAALAVVLAGNLPIGGMVAFPLGGVLALLWAWRSRTPWRAIGFVPERNWLATVALGVLLGVALKLALKAIVVLTSALFGAAHLADQGVPGAQQAAIVGLVFGTIYATTGRLALVMIAHTAFDLTALAIIHLGLEEAFARALFR